MRSPGRRGGAAGPAAGTGAGGAGAGFAADAAGADAGTAAALGWAAGEGASVFAGAGTGAAAAAPSESITPTMVWIGTVCPSPTLISFSTPAEGEGISASTLSVEISNSGSSRSTLSPGFFSHLVIVPSKMLSPIWGITMSTAIFLLLRVRYYQDTGCQFSVFSSQSKLHKRNGFSLSTEHSQLSTENFPQYRASSFAAAKTFFAFGRKCSSSVGAYGTGVSSEVTRISGPSRSPNAFSHRIAAISPAIPPVFVSSCTTRHLLVFFTEVKIVSSSSGSSVRKSITSASMPSFVRASAASSEVCIIAA